MSTQPRDAPRNLFGPILTSIAATWYARRRGVPGMEFARFGRRIGFQMLLRRARPSVSYLITPVSITRYFEFPFALSCLPAKAARCLDVSSPSLFSFYVAHKTPDMTIRMINPDASDCVHTRAVLSRLGPPNIRLDPLDLRSALSGHETYDCIWSLSVIEHVAGDYDDRCAIEMMYQALNPGGRLILTTPIDRYFWNEYRRRDVYGTGSPQSAGQFFFQRNYDKEAIWERIVSPIGKEPSIVRWFGEIIPGRFNNYELRWMREGYGCTANDPREIADYYREFPSWEQMPGKGVCGLMFEKD